MMRLPRVRKTKTKTAVAVKKTTDIDAQIQKYKEGFKRSKVRFRDGKVKLSDFNYGVIESTEALEVLVLGGSVRVDNSWEGVILLLINAVYNKFGAEKFEYILSEHRLTGTGKNIEIERNGVVKISYDRMVSRSREEYREYSLFDKPYIVSGVFSTDNIFDAIIKLIVALQYEREQVEFKVRGKGRN